MLKTYVLVTPARNEEAYIENTIKSVIAQTILPQKWAIVSDSSTDHTDEIVKRYADQYDFIEFMRLESDVKRNFASQVYAQHAGADLLKDIEYDFIGMLDADVTFRPDYYERLLKKFHNNPKLGIAGGVPFDLRKGKWVRQYVSNLWSVSGPIQMFRKQCFKDIGGYIPLKNGGQDGIAEVMARMKGWQVRSFPDIEVLHYRLTGTEMQNPLLAHFYHGMHEYSNGYQPFYEIAKCISRVPNTPFVFGSILRLSGFFWAFLLRKPRAVPTNIITYMRREQVQRLFATLFRRKLA